MGIFSLAVFVSEGCVDVVRNASPAVFHLERVALLDAQQLLVQPPVGSVPGNPQKRPKIKDY